MKVRCIVPLGTSHNRALWFQLPVSTSLPFGENATEVTMPTYAL